LICASYSPGLAPSDFHLFGPLKKHQGRRRFATDSEVQQAIMSWLQARDTDFFYGGINALVYRGTNASASMGIVWKNNLYKGHTIDYTCICYLNKFIYLLNRLPTYVIPILW
jgi:hypothetical protein